MAFQPNSFQPLPKTSLRSKLARGFRAVHAFVVPAKDLSLLEESAWQRGKRQASELAKGKAILFMTICAPLFAVGGLFVLTSVWLPLRIVLAALIGLGLALAASLLIAGSYALRAPYHQSDEARERLSQLETTFKNYQREVQLRFTLMTIANTIKDGIEGARARAVAGEDISGDRAFFQSVTPHVATELETAGLGHLADNYRTEDYRLDEPNDVLNSMSQFSNKLLALVADASQFPEASRLIAQQQGAST